MPLLRQIIIDKKFIINLSKRINHAKTWFFEALFPPKCLICAKEGNYLCSKHKKFKPAPPNTANFQYLDEIYAVTKYYDSTAERIIKFFKFKGFKELAQIMANEIIKSKPPNFWHNTIIIPIPLHWTRKFWRGFNQAELLANEIKKQIPNIKLSNNLKRIKRTPQQSKLKKQERIKNMMNAFVWKGAPLKQKIILIDDVVASGATLDSASKILKKAGAPNIIAIVFARGGK